MEKELTAGSGGHACTNWLLFFIGRLKGDGHSRNSSSHFFTAASSWPPLICDMRPMNSRIHSRLAPDNGQERERERERERRRVRQDRRRRRRSILANASCCAEREGGTEKRGLALPLPSSSVLCMLYVRSVYIRLYERLCT